MDSRGTPADWLSGGAAAATGLGVVSVALFPLAVPFVILAIVATLPLALPVLVLAALGAIIVGTWRALRAIARALRGTGHRGERESPAGRQRDPVAHGGPAIAGD